MTLEANLALATVRPVLIAWFDIKDDPIYGWTGVGAFAPSGTGDADLDGNVFLESEGPITISPVSEDQGLGGDLTLTFPVGESSGIPTGPFYDQLVADRRAFLGRRAVVWLGFLSSDESSVLPDLQRLFSGVMVGAAAVREQGQGRNISITLGQDTQKARTAPTRWADHQVFNAGDTASTYLNAMSRGGVAGSASSSQPVNGGVPVPRVPRRGKLR